MNENQSLQLHYKIKKTGFYTYQTDKQTKNDSCNGEY